MRWLHFILSHSIFISLCAAALVFQSSLLLRLQLSLAFYGFIFCITLCGYNSYWLAAKYFSNRSIAFWTFVHKEWTGFFIFIVAFVGALMAYVKQIVPFSIIFPAILLGGLYTLPLMPVKAIGFARKAGVLKTVVLSFTWSYVTVNVPLQKTFFQLNNTEWFVFSRRFLFMLMLCIIFDTRDVVIDKIRGLHSLATDLSDQALKVVIAAVFLVLFITNFLFHEITFLQSLSLQVSTVALLVVYFFSKKKQGYFFYYFLVDGMMLFSALLTFLASI